MADTRDRTPTVHAADGEQAPDQAKRGHGPAVGAEPSSAEQVARTQWAAALRWVEPKLKIMSRSTVEWWLSDCADRIEAGELTPWAPGEPAGERPAADQTPAEDGDGPILGRALVDRDGNVWRQVDGGYRCGGPVIPRPDVDAWFGPVQDALVVTPAAGRLIEAAQQWRDTEDLPDHALDDQERALMAAVDALDGDRPAEGGEVRGDG
jgi:hypothetical protein